MKSTSTIRRRRRTRSAFGGLIALNAALLCGLAAATFIPRADAQFRAAGVYHATTGTVPGVDAGAIYIVDEANQGLIALTYNPNTKRLEGVGARDLAADAVQYRGSRN